MASSQAALFLKCILTADIKYKQTDYLNIMRYNEQIALKKILCQKQQQTCAKTTCEAIYKEQLFLCISNTSISC